MENGEANNPNEFSQNLNCPACGQIVDRPDDLMTNVVVCPHCGHQFFIELTPEEEPDDDDEAARAALEREHNAARDLDGLRIRALSAERRAMYRTRSFLILAVAGCVIAIYELAERLWHGGFNRAGQLSMVMLMIGCALGIPFFVKKIRVLQAELRVPRLKEPDSPPDFGPLEDGSQTWKQLDEMSKPKEDDAV